MFGKHFSSMYNGSMVGAGAHVFAVWGYCISNADASMHTVRLNPALLATVLGEPVDKIKDAIEFLEKPDKDSCCTDHEGSRIVNTSGMEYLVVSHEHYRGIKSHTDRTEYMREYMRKRREKGNDVNTCKHESLQLTHTYASVSASDSVSTDRENYAETTDKWNSLAEKHGLAKIREITGRRRKHYKARLSENADFWDVLEKEIPELNNFALGKQDGKKWKITFDYCVSSQDKFNKLAEGNYRKEKVKVWHSN